MNAVIASLVLSAFVALGFLFVFVALLVGMRTEGTRLRTSNSPHCPVGNAARRLLGLYVRRPDDGTRRAAQNASRDRVGR